MLSISELKTGVKIVQNTEPYEVVSSDHLKMGRGQAVVRTKLKNLITGTVREETFHGNDSVEEADLSEGKAQFLYHDDSGYFFMDNQSFEQFSLTAGQLGDKKDYLVPDTEVSILNFNEKPINVQLPIKMAFKVVDAPPSIKGNTAQSGSYKEVTLETGLKMQVPLFIKEGEKVLVNTEEGHYVERAK